MTPPADSPATPLPFPELRSRLTLTPLSAREVLASWTLRPDDWNVALEWVGPDAVHAVLAVRLFDITDLIFNGSNAHSIWDVELGLRRAASHDRSSVRRPLAGRLTWGCVRPRGTFTRSPTPGFATCRAKAWHPACRPDGCESMPAWNPP